MEQVMDQVTKTMTIGEVVEKYPAAADVLQQYGLQCIGCHVNPYESIESGARGHGMDEAQINQMVKHLNGKLREEPSAHERVIVTKKATEKFRQLLETENINEHYIRVGVRAGGCSGYKYLLDFTKESQKEDIILEQDGVKFAIDQTSMPLLKGTTLDYVDGLNESGFKFNNPNAKSSCGCGSSFS
ncbi:iron-sulfur cluster assembly accessory protein [Candidatus Woesearchaeota archaeon]|nr:iron-sulfur cluster assembly accessory protein [Candidatus Woesearchaeota archaeon]